MNIEDYYNKLTDIACDNLEKSLVKKDQIGYSHHISYSINELGDCIIDKSEKEMFKIVSSQLESSSLCASLGMYRQAFSSLRLALEMFLGLIYFSVHKLDFKEWIDGRSDIIWSQINDQENGVLSKRFASSFFPELENVVESYQCKASSVYRSLSEYVHGNYDTWEENQLKLEFDQDLMDEFYDKFEIVSEVILFSFCCRYLKTIDDDTLETLDTVREELSHIEAIRNLLGGPVE